VVVVGQVLADIEEQAAGLVVERPLGVVTDGLDERVELTGDDLQGNGESDHALTSSGAGMDVDGGSGTRVSALSSVVGLPSASAAHPSGMAVPRSTAR
jgi:hypothetical protein